MACESYQNAPAMSPDLSSLRPHINGRHLQEIFATRHPWEMSEPFCFAKVRDYASRLPLIRLRELLYPALYALSRHPNFTPLLYDVNASVPSLLPLLSPSLEPQFPGEATALLLLLDQGPRQLFQGVDKRWAFGFFDNIALRTAKELLALPEAESILSRQRWQARGFTELGHWAYFRTWTIAVLVHSEHPSAHAQADVLIKETRSTIEMEEGSKDEWWSQPDEVKNDPMGFLHVLMEGPPMGDHISVSSFMFWWLRVMATHEPVIRKFGRYPNRDGALSRTDTKEEEEYLKQLNYFGCVNEDVATKIRSDVESGRWTPLPEVQCQLPSFD